MQSFWVSGQKRLHSMQSCFRTTALYAIVLGPWLPMSAYNHVVWCHHPKLHDYMQTWALRCKIRLHIMQTCENTIALYAMVLSFWGPMSAYSHVVWEPPQTTWQYADICPQMLKTITYNAVVWKRDCIICIRFGHLAQNDCILCSPVFTGPQYMQSFWVSEVPCLRIVM